MVDESQTNEQQSPSKTESLAELFRRAASLRESSPSEAVAILEDVQRQVARLSLFSSNEETSDISTNSLPFIALEHYLAVSFMNIPNGPSQLKDRLAHLYRACDLWSAFLSRLEQMDVLNKEEQTQYHDLIEVQSSVSSNEPGQMPLISMPPPTNRDVKIARFKQKQAAEHERQRLQSLQDRRNRLGLAEQDELDGFDCESLARKIHLQSLDVCKAEALEEWSSVVRELPMILMMAQRQEHVDTTAQKPINPDQRTPPSNQPLRVTRITQDATGQLQIREEEIRSQVFQPHWHQPTMSLDELAEKEVAEAMEREQRQKESEEKSKNEARRYELLEKDGLEDNAELVDASAALDRKWDDWKDANPRGSGNKRGNVGDRNF